MKDAPVDWDTEKVLEFVCSPAVRDWCVAAFGKELDILGGKRLVMAEFADVFEVSAAMITTSGVTVRVPLGDDGMCAFLCAVELYLHGLSQESVRV